MAKARSKPAAPQAQSAVRGAAPMSLEQATALGQANLNSGFPIPKRAAAVLDEAGVTLVREELTPPAPETTAVTPENKDA